MKVVRFTALYVVGNARQNASVVNNKKICELQEKQSRGQSLKIKANALYC